MSVMTAIHGTGAEVYTMRAFYIGTDKLYEGYPLCWNWDATDVTPENVTQTSPDVGQDKYNAARRIQVEKPAEGNKLHFAGAVSQKSSGMTGPGWVEIHRPGSVCNVYAASSVDHGQTGLTTATGQTVTFRPGTYTFVTGGYPGCGTAVVLQDVNRSSVNGLVMAELMGGEVSGGHALVDCLSSTSALSTAVGAVMVMAGVYTLTDATNGLGSGAVMDVQLGLTDASYVGQKVKFVMEAVIISEVIVSINVSTAHTGCLSDGGTGIVSGYCDLSLNADELELRFNGARWCVVTSEEAGMLITV